MKQHEITWWVEEFDQAVDKSEVFWGESADEALAIAKRKHKRGKNFNVVW